MTNISSLIARRAFSSNEAKVNTALQRLSTGLRVNSAKDDPAGLIASENLRSEEAKINAAIGNATRAGNLMATAEGGLSETANLLLQLQSLVTQSANVGGISADEKAANQLQADSIVNTIDRISNNSTFDNRKLLDGSLKYALSGVNPSALPLVNVSRANAGANVVVDVTASARTAALTYSGGPVGPGGLTLDIAGNAGDTQLSFASGTTTSAIAAAITSVKSQTGLSASIVAGNLEVHSVGYGSASFVKVHAISGTFTGGEGESHGRDAGVTINGVTATVRGLSATVRNNGLDVSLTLGASFNTANAQTSFAVAGGGALFSLGAGVTALGLDSVSIGAFGSSSLGITQLAAGGLGALSFLRSGGGVDLGSRDAQDILDSAITQVSTTRGQIGAFLKYDVDATVDTLQVQLENVTAADSAIRDADFAEETSNLTRYQILAQAASAMISQANAQPQIALKLLQDATGR